MTRGGDRAVQLGAGEVEGELDLAGLAFGGDRRVERAQEARLALHLAEAHAITDLEAFRRPGQRAPAARIHALGEIEADARLRRAAMPRSRERGRNDARVVHDQRIARPEQLRQIADSAILAGRLVARPHDEKARRIARTRWMERDPVVGQLVVEEIRAHQAMVRVRAKGRNAERAADV